jgi:hypothetical protein
VSSGFDDQVGTLVAASAHVAKPACPRRLIPKNIRPIPDTSIWLSSRPLSTLESNVFVSAWFHPRKMSEVVAYDNIMKKRKARFEYHLFGFERVELDRRRRFELNVNRFSYWMAHRKVVVCMYWE